MAFRIISRYFLLISTAGLPFLEEDEEEIDEKIVIKAAYILLL